MKNRWITLAAKLAVSGGLLWVIAANFDIGASAARLKDLDIGYLLAAAGVFVLLLANNTARWRTVMRAIDAVLPL